MYLEEGARREATEDIQVNLIWEKFGRESVEII